MSLNDTVVLEFLHEHDLELPPKALWANLNRHGHDIGYSTVQLRLSKLEDHDLVEKAESGYYQLSGKGEQWLDDEIGIEEMED
ncbi:winged-helix domain-containing protein [Halolamina salina]|uniref:Winged-helix domain-containing protein n=1 Tax=Halolamina salina TaxID=1220023 RepID=A0ABD6BAF8_9EURY